MKQLILLTLTFCYSINSFSQVGIGTAEPNASSQLEVKADDKGVLLPQVVYKAQRIITPFLMAMSLVFWYSYSNRILRIIIVLIINFIEKINFNFKTP